jgi:cytochrome c553
MKRSARWVAASATALVLVSAAAWIAWRFNSDIEAASAKAAQRSVLVCSRCGPIEHQEAGTGTPLLMIHGSGGGHAY